MADDRLDRQFAFLADIDRLKTVERRTALVDRSRLENSAEHSWHAAVMAVVLAEHAPAGVSIDHVVRILLVHDIVEVDAGDTFAYDPVAHRDKAARERAAAQRIFGLLPPDQGDMLRGLWDEFEAGVTPEARYANALDRFAGLLQNWAGGDGGTWRQHNVTREAVLARMTPSRTAPPGCGRWCWTSSNARRRAARWGGRGRRKSRLRVWLMSAPYGDGPASSVRNVDSPAPEITQAGDECHRRRSNVGTPSPEVIGARRGLHAAPGYLQECQS